MKSPGKQPKNAVQWDATPWGMTRLVRVQFLAEVLRNEVGGISDFGVFGLKEEEGLRAQLWDLVIKARDKVESNIRG